jgi:serine/threonine-protein kinase HipA
MRRSSRLRILDLWMNGERVGRWTVHRGEHLLRYTEEWLASRHRRPLSLSMPLRPSDEPYRTSVVQPFFDNLLPDSDEIRRRLMARFGTSSTSAFDLLEEVGRDCVGAVQLLAPDAPPPDVRTIKGHRVTSSKIAEHLSKVRSPSMGAQDVDDFRISLPGAQEKTAFLRYQRSWWVPEGPTPTTHIFKLPMIASDARGPDFTTSVENEWLCAQLLPRFGVPCARCEIRTFKDQTVLVVERFDRVLSEDGAWIIRRPQEDLCQATQTPPGQKYESQGGPGLFQVMELLRGSTRATEDREDFFRTQFLFWLLCAIDGHAKNFSLFIEPEGRFVLTPRYDVLSAYPVLGRRQNQLSPHKVKMAMAVQGHDRHYRWREIRVDHWLETGRLCGLPASGRPLLEETLERVSSAISAVETALPNGFPTSVSDPIFEGLRDAAERARAALSRRPA